VRAPVWEELTEAEDWWLLLSESEIRALLARPQPEET
jgi:hypothetical protein